MAESGCWAEEHTMTLSLDHDTTRVAESVSTDRLMEDTREIARWVRLSGSPEERRAFAYIERRLREAGLRTQLLEHDALISLPQAAALRLSDPDPEEIPCITHSFAVSTPRDGIAAEAVAGGGRRVRVRLTTAVQTGWRRLPLLVAEADGTGDDTFVLLAGHVDSWHYGAMDNGGANAVMMEVGRLLARTRLYRGLRLTFWSGHSHGRYAGSTWYVDSHWDELNARCAAHLNVDSVGGRGATKLDAGYCMPETREVGVRVVGALAGQQYRGTRVGRSGDQSFLGIGVPSLFMSLSEHPADGPEASRDFSSTGIAAGGGLGWGGHTPQETVDKLDPAAWARGAPI